MLAAFKICNIILIYHFNNFLAEIKHNVRKNIKQSKTDRYTYIEGSIFQERLAAIMSFRIRIVIKESD